MIVLLFFYISAKIKKIRQKKNVVCCALIQAYHGHFCLRLVFHHKCSEDMLNLFQHSTGQYTALHYRGFTFELVSADGVLKQVQHDKEVAIQAKKSSMLVVRNTNRRQKILNPVQ